MPGKGDPLCSTVSVFWVLAVKFLSVCVCLTAGRVHPSIHFRCTGSGVS